MTNDERLVERLVTYSIELHGRTIIVEDVPAKVDTETGEQWFSAETVERLQTVLSGDPQHDRLLYAADPEQSAASRDAAITAQLNRVYRDDPGGLDPALRRAQRRWLDTSA